MPSPLRLRATLILVTALAACAEAAPVAVAPSAPAAAPIAVAIAPERATESEEHAAVPVLPDDPTWGSRFAPVTMVMFSDFQCPYCGKLAVTVDALEAAYGRDQLRLVWKNKPLAFHPNAKPAAEAGAGVFALGGGEAFWHFYALAFANQGQLGEASYEAWAAEAGVDPVTLRHGIEDHRWVAKVEADNATADRLGVSGTPASFINGVLISGALPLEKFKEQIDAELAKGRDLEREGTAADHVYTARAQANFTGKPIVTKPAKREDTTTVYRVPVGHSPTRGKATALVTIVEFADFQCPYCARAEATLAQIRTTYGDQVRFVWKDAPISAHPRAKPAMELGREARAEQGDGGFWKVHDAIFASAPKLEDADLDAIAGAAGLDVAKVRRAIDQNVYEAKTYDDEDLADEVQASGTPHFFINGRRLVGAQPFDKFQKLIDEEIVHASTMVAGGVPASGVYERIIRDGSRGPRFDTASLPLAPHAPSLGSAGAQVVIQELGDFQCPLCAQTEDTVKEVMKLYGSKVRLVWRDDPSQAHADGAFAAEAAREALAQRGATGFWAMHDLLVKNQPANGVADGFTRPALDGYAAQLGLDLGRWGAALDAHTHKAAVDTEVQLAQAAGISSAPAFVIGGYLVTGHAPAARFRRVIDEVLAHGPAAPTHHATSGAPGGTTVLPDGLRITDTAVGTGPAARSGDRVSVHYVGSLTDGTVFDSSRTRNSPFEVQLGLGSVIKGWEEGLLGMKVGGKRKLVIPAALGYGSRGAGGRIPPDSVLVFDIEMLGIQ